MPSNAEILIDAIRNRLQITTIYDGHLRHLCPHAIGYKHGRLQAISYQFAGTSSSGLKPIGHPNNWRCMRVDQMAKVEASPGTWYTSWNHSQPQTCIDQILAEVTY